MSPVYNRIGIQGYRVLSSEYENQVTIHLFYLDQARATLNLSVGDAQDLSKIPEEIQEAIFKERVGRLCRDIRATSKGFATTPRRIGKFSRPSRTRV